MPSQNPNQNQNKKQNKKAKQQQQQEAPAMSFTQNSGNQEEKGANRLPQ